MHLLGYDPAGERRAGSSQINLLDLWKMIKMSTHLLPMSTLGMAVGPAGLSWFAASLLS